MNITSAYSKALICLFIIGTTLATLGSESPMLTSSFFGTVTVDGNAIPDGTVVTATIGDIDLETASVYLSPEGSSFRIDVPGDVPATAPDEGGVEGESVVFRIGDSEAPEIGVWRVGAVQRIDLSATAGPDLSIAQSDGRETVQAGESLTYSLTITNETAAGATGVLVTEDLPLNVSLVAASDGGVLSGSRVSWPPFALAGNASVVRTLTIELAPSFPAGVESLTLTATVADDGVNGFDPDASNNTAADTDTLDAAPDLAVSKTDGLEEISPGEDFAYILTITNAGTQDASGVTLVDTLPEGVTFFTASDDGGETSPGFATWPVFDLAVGETIERTIQLRFDGTPGATLITNSATATPGNGPDQDSSDNIGTDTTSVAQRVDLEAVAVDAFQMVTDFQSLQISGSVRVDIENLGNGDATGSFEISLWEDSDGDGVLTGADNLLAESSVSGGVLSGETATFDLAVAGTVSFRDNRIYAFVDSAEELAELDETNNVGHSAEGCIAAPVAEDFAPVVEMSWPADDTNLSVPESVESMSTPIVVQLTDDNGDGHIDEGDGPDIVFVSFGPPDPFHVVPLKLRAIHGDTGRSIWLVDPPVSEFLAFSLSGLAAGDIDGDGIAEILVATPEPPTPPFEGFGNKITAYEHTGERKWSSAYYSTHPTGATFTNRDNPTIADLDRDGTPEIVVGGNVFNAGGSLRWAGTGGQAYQSASNNDNVDSGAISVVANLDLEGDPEVVTGNTAYRSDGSIYWQLPMDDGYPAVGNFDADDFPEIVVVARGRVRLHEHDGTLIWGPVDLPGAGAEAGGAPTIADFDGDGEVEIGVAGSTLYTVFETDGTPKWSSSIQDGSSNMTGSTVFDLDGDGDYEVIYRDETHLRIYRGDDGTVLFEDPVSSFTANEGVVVADVDRDGRAEIVVSSDEAQAIPGLSVRTFGIRVYGDANDNWIGTRSIWNQHAYHSDNVGDDGSIPIEVAPSWLDHNTFRANVAPATGAFDATDLTASRIVVDFSAYPQLTFTARIGNGGLTPALTGTPVAFYDGDPDAGGTLIAVAELPFALEPGQLADLDVSSLAATFGSAAVFVVAGDDGAGGGRRRECRTDNNEYSLTFNTDDVGLLLTLDDGQTAVQAGSLMTYALTVSNASGFERTGVALSDVLPPHTSVVSASDGGTESGGSVTWPPFSLPTLSTVIRTLTLQVDPAIPVTVTSLTNSATVTDDGSHGADPTPANNTASDINQVLTVRADAGGPYSGDEGVAINFDASGSSDRDGTVVSFAWDLDGDGVFDDATGVFASRVFSDNGGFTVAVRVTDDSGEVDTDSAEVTVGNAPPVVDAGPDQTLTEGGAITLSATVFTDSGPDDTHTATVDWGDGTLEAGVVDQAMGTIFGSHEYPHDGVFQVEVCVSDDDGDTTCDSFVATVENADPLVVETSRSIDFRTWTADHRGAEANWVAYNGGAWVEQFSNTDPSVFIAPTPGLGVRYRGLARVNTGSDDDFMGFVLGFQPGDWQNPGADFLLIDWRQRDQDGSAKGLAISRVTGNSPDVYRHSPSSSFQELARGIRFGNIGWGDGVTYVYTLESSPNRVRLWVNDVLEFDIEGTFDFADGRFGFYDFSQPNAEFFNWNARGIGIVEGETADLSLTFSDVGVLDTHTATIDWQDGTVESGTLTEEDGSGTVTGSHLYPDDATLEIEVCVDDEDGGLGCALVQTVVSNMPPTVDAGIDRFALFDDEPAQLATFTDLGVLDTHTATVDWGDGTADDAVVEQVSGGGTVRGLHAYDLEGTYTVEVCVTDDDGGRECDSFEATWLTPVHDLTISKTAALQAVRPGETLTYTLVVANAGTVEPRDVVVTDTLPAELTFSNATGGGIYDAGSHTVTWTLPILAYQASAVLNVSGVPVTGLALGTTFTNSAIITDDGRFGPDINPADNEDAVTALFWDGETPRLTFEPLVGEEGSVAQLSVALHDTDETETHTATVDWGDGVVEPAVVSGPPSAGTVAASHVFPDDVSGTIEVCVTDSSGHTGCFTIPLEIANDVPTVLRAGEPDLRTWTKREYTFDQDPADWLVADDGRTVLQTAQSFPSFFYGDVEARGATIRARVVVEGTDDDFFGFALGFDPSNWTTAESDYLLVDWKGKTQNFGGQASRQGLVVSRVRGFVPFDERGNAFWLRWNTPHHEVLARGATLGDARWFAGASYDFVFTLTENRLQVSVNGSPEIDITGDFPAGRFGFYNLSQDGVRYSTFTITSTEIVEGSAIEPIEIEFRDQGLLDTHAGIVDWQDGSTEALAVTYAGGGVGSVSVSHLYQDDGVYAAEICVEDDDGGLGCEISKITVSNVAPTVTAADDLLIPITGANELTLATFTDPALPDTHTATVDWGDGSAAESATVDQGAGSGTVTGVHAYGGPDVYSVEVCVTDDDGGAACDSLMVTAAATQPPTVASILIPNSTEGDTVELTAIFVDLDPGDNHTATVDWGDGSPVEAGTVAQSAGGGVVSGSHFYRDDLTSAVEVCVTDSVDQTDCDSVPLEVQNFVPEVAGGDLDLSSWQFETYTSGYAVPEWTVTATGTSAQQSQTSKPTIFFGDVPVLGRRITGKLSVRTSSNQGFIGLALGFEPGDVTDPDADFLLLDWRQRTETTSFIGMALWHITGPSTGLFSHNGDDIEELARANTLGQLGWVDLREYELTVEFTERRLRVWVDGVLEFDVEGDFPDGFLGFYSYAQAQTRFRNFRLEGLVLDEGETAFLEAGFFDAGPDDTHLADIDWQDGTPVDSGVVTPGGLGGNVMGSHVYLDNGDFTTQLCVTDDDLGTGCGDFQAQVANVAPVVDAGPDIEASAGAEMGLDGVSFTDPGTGDTHTATVDWGDGTTEAATVIQGAGTGTIDAGHVFAATGLYTGEVCVTDDDGGAGCDALAIEVTAGSPMLSATKIDVLAEDRDGDTQASPGDVVRYDVTVSNVGSSAASGVMLRDLIPALTSMVPGSVATSVGTVLSEDPVEVDLGELAGGLSATVSFEAEIANPVPSGIDRITNQGTVTSDQLPAVSTDDPDLGGNADPTETLITAAPNLVAEKSDAIFEDADGNSVPSPGDVFEYTVRIFNNGNTSATDVVFEDPVPEHTTIVPGSVTSDRGTVDSEDPVTVMIGEIVGGMDVVTLRFQVIVDSPVAAGVMDVVNQGLVRSTELADLLTDDPDVGGDADPTETMIQAEPKLTAEKIDVLFDDVDGNGVASPGDVLLYQLTVDNSGNTAATGVVLSDPIPDHTTLEAGSLQISQGAILSEDPIEIALGQLLAGDTAAVTFRVVIDDPFPLELTAVINQATVESAELAPSASDDPDTVQEADPTVTEVFIAPSHDACVSAIELSCPAGGGMDTAMGTTLGAALDSAGTCGTTNTAPGVWYRITGNGDGITVDTCTLGTYNTKISVYEDGCGTLTCVTGNDDFCVTQSSVTWTSAVGVEYLILVHGLGAEAGDFTLTLSCMVPVELRSFSVE